MNTETKVTIGILLITAALLGGLVWYGGRQSTLGSDLPTELKDQITADPASFPVGDLVNEDDYQSGSQSALVTLVEFSDFQCPYCKSAHPQIQALRDTYSEEQLRLVYRHLPLVELGHTLAYPAARAAQAATIQGKGGEYINAVFENELSLGDEYFQQLASDLGLDMNKFNTDLNSDDVAWQAYRARTLFEERGYAFSTPTIYINAIEYKGARTTEALKTYIDSLLSFN